MGKVDKELPRELLRPNEPSKLEMFVSELQKTGTSDGWGVVKSVTVRLPALDFATIEALSRAGGMPRNKVIVKLVESAIEEMWTELSPEMHEIVSGLQAEIYQGLSHDETTPGGEI